MLDPNMYEGGRTFRQVSLRDVLKQASMLANSMDFSMEEVTSPGKPGLGDVARPNAPVSGVPGLFVYVLFLLLLFVFCCVVLVLFVLLYNHDRKERNGGANGEKHGAKYTSKTHNHTCVCGCLFCLCIWLRVSLLSPQLGRLPAFFGCNTCACSCSCSRFEGPKSQATGQQP